jgi:toxin YhaV
MYTWVSDPDTRRAYENNGDAYRVFRKMLESGCPPDSWEALLREAQAMAERLRGAASRTAGI